MKNKSRVGIFGGTFNPPHNGHVSVAEQFSKALELDKLFVIPDYIPPHKEYAGNVTPQQRLEMCERAFSHIDRAVVSDWEIRREGKSYTYLTLEEFSSKDRDLFFLCGTDMFLTLDSWRCPEKIFKLATICYVRRENDPGNTELIDFAAKKYIDSFDAKIFCLPVKAIEASSSEIRDDLANGNGEKQALLPSGVLEYIKEQGLYV